MDDERIQLARDILAERVGAAGLSISDLELLGWNASSFGYYGWPTAEENREKARDIIEYDDRLRGRESNISDTLKHITEAVKRMTPDEFRESLVRAGIVDKDGMLTEPYRED